jgi:GGDEF domain-containing protein
MKTVLVDNATVRAVLSLMAVSQEEPRPDSKLLDLSLICTEELIEALVLSEQVVTPKIHHDYPEIVPELNSLLGQSDVVSWLGVSSEQLVSAEESVSLRLSKWAHEDDNFTSVLSAYGGYSRSTAKWDRWVIRRYSPYSGYRMTFACECHFAEPYVKLAEAGQQLPQIESESDTAGILWLVSRALLYDSLATERRIPYAPHPLRASLWKAIQIRMLSGELFHKLPIDILTDARITLGEKLLSGRVKSFEIEIPPLLAYVLSRANTRDEIFPRVMELRDSRGARRMRKELTELSEAVAGGDSALDVLRQVETRKVLRQVEAFNKFARSLAVEWDLANRPKISPAIQFLAFSIGTEASVPRALVQAKSMVTQTVRPHFGLLRNIFDSTTRIWSMSALVDRHFGSVRLDSIISTGNVMVGPEQGPWPDDDGDWDIDHIEDPELATSIDVRAKLRQLISSRTACVIVVADVDDLSQWNTLLSRRTGDVILNKFGIALRNTAPAIMTRIAGDTFVAIYTDKRTESSIGRKIQKRVNESVWIDSWWNGKRWKEIRGGDKYLPTISIGTSAYSGTEWQSADRLFGSALSKLEECKLRKPPHLMAGWPRGSERLFMKPARDPRKG